MKTEMSQARAFVAASHGRLREVAEEIGVSYDWITKFSQGRIQDPGWSRIHRLAELSKKKAA